MRSVPSAAWRRVTALIASTALVLLLAAPVAAAGPFGTVTVNPEAGLDMQADTLLVSGSVECTAAGSIELPTFATQEIGQALVTGSAFGSIVCPEAGTTQTWEVTVFPDSGRFNPGRIDIFIEAQHCDASSCTADPIEATVWARPLGKVTPPPAPANDEPGGALGLELDGTPFMQDTSAATNGATDPVCPEIQPFASHTVWFTISSATDTGIELSTVGSNFDTTLTVLDQSGTPIACNDDIEPGVNRQSNLVFAATAGTTYTIVAGSWEATNGGSLVLTAISVAVPPPPPPPPPVPVNDVPLGALPLVIGTPASQNTVGATVGPEDPAGGVCDLPSNGATVWYTLAIAPADVGWVQVDTFGSDYDTTLYVFDSAGGLLACNDQAGGISNQSLLVFLAEAGTYSVLVGSWNSLPGGSLVLTASPTIAPLAVDVTIDPIGSVVTRSGDAMITGTITCSEAASGGISVSLFQEGGRFTANSGGGMEIASCGPTPTAWSVVVPRGTAKFQAGIAFAAVEGFLASDTGESQAFADGEVQLRPAGARP